MADEIVLEFDTPPGAAENVVAFRRREPADDEVTFVRANGSPCRHRPFVIDEKQRTVQCGTCGAWLDPIWCLLRFVEIDEALTRRRQAIEALERHQSDRQQRAIARKDAARKRAELQAAAENCGACDGTGWVYVVVDGVQRTQRCDCRKRLGAARLL